MKVKKSFIEDKLIVFCVGDFGEAQYYGIEKTHI